MTDEAEFGFRRYQAMAAATDQVPMDGDKSQTAIMVPLLGLAGEAGSLLSEFKKWLRQGDIYKPFEGQVTEELGDILWYVSNIASKLDIDLEEVARVNLAKLEERYETLAASGMSQGRLFPAARVFDEMYPPDEQLPSELKAEFRPVTEGGVEKLAVTINGSSCGDSLTDNSHWDDGYRFHDVFHMTLCCRLGWSPIMRKLLRRKRKSEPQIDEVEDGARAGITEEAISAVVFAFAQGYSLFDGASLVEFSLLRTIKEMTHPFEVRTCNYRQWETAILEAFSVWRQMIGHNGGIFVGSRDEVHYEPLA